MEPQRYGAAPKGKPMKHKFFAALAGIGIVAWVGLAAWARPAAAALTPDEVRGGWIADAGGQRHIYLLNVRGQDIRGIYCWDCSNPENLAFVVDGKLEGDGFRFALLHESRSGGSYRENVAGRIVDGRLAVRVQRQGGNAPAVEMTLMREPRRPSSGLILPGFIAPVPAGVPQPPAPVSPLGGGGRGVPGGGGTNTNAPVPVPGAVPAGARGRGGYVVPGPNEALTAATVTGLWLWGTGPGKQYFMFRPVGAEIRGMVCGPCDNPFTFGALDHGVIMGDQFEFDIVHEDWGSGIQNGPFNNHATATVSMNEMHIATRQDNRAATGPALEMTMLGPIRLK
jgi:hypothetical protein